jgi:serine/threonine-protein kinase
MKHIHVLMFATALALTACGGGDYSVAVSDDGGYTVESGVAQKGPLAQGSAIWVNELAATTFKPNGKQYTFRTTNDFGTFAPSGIKYGTPYLSTLAQGYYYNEITGTQSDDIVLLSGLSQIGAVSNSAADTAINVNVLSSMAVNRITKLATTSPIRTFAVARAKAQKETLGAFYIYNDASILSGKVDDGVVQPANLTALDLSKNRAADQILAAVSAVVMKAGVNGAGVNVLLSQISSDLEDDGELNNSINYRTSVQSKLCAAAAVTDFANVATNLNNLYGTTYLATDLSQWVDTSGCVDQVINKYKFSANNIAVGTVSKSPAYKVGDDDVGQCFSVGGATTGATVGLYYNGAATAVVGTQLVNAGDSVAIGINAGAAGTFSGFIQRSAPAANGSCPTVVPLNGLTRVAKYATDNGYTIGGTVSGLATGQVLTLLNNGGSALVVSANGAFTFATSLAANTPYAVTVDTHPKGQTCNVTNATGTTGTVNVSNVVLTCKATNSNDYSNALVSTLAGSGAPGSVDGVSAIASFSNPFGVGVDGLGNVYVADPGNNKIRKVSPQGVVTTFAGSGVADNIDGIATSASMFFPLALAVDVSGNIFVAANEKIRKITPQGVVTTVAGGLRGSADGTGIKASFAGPQGLAVDSAGNIYVADTENNKIRKITPQGVVSTLAGSGAPGSTDGTGTAASFRHPDGVAVDTNGNVYVADTLNNKIRKISPQGVVTTFASCTATSIAIDAKGYLYINDIGGNIIKMISPLGVVSNLAGTGLQGSADGPVASASFFNPSGITVDAVGNIYIAEYGNNKIRKITPQ